MSLLLDQLVYTSFPGVGLRALASVKVPLKVQQAFIQHIVYRYWDSYNPPKAGYWAAYLYQVTPEDSLFGWLYNDGLDDLGRNHVPYFICYYLAGPLQTVQLEKVFACLHRGPIAPIDRQNLPVTLETIVASDCRNYQPVREGVAVPKNVRDRSYVALEQKRLLDLFIPVKDEQIAPIAAQRARQKAAVHPPNRIAGTTMAQAGSRDEAVKRIKLLKETVITNETQAFALHETGLSQDKRKSQMAKIALLIGVSDYGPGFDSIPRAQRDVQAIQQILQHPEIGNFAEVRTLLNPDRQAMEEAIETLFLESQRDNLVLLYFSGFGVEDDHGKLYLATNITRKNSQGKLIKSSAVPVSFVQEIMSDSRSRHQVVVLDWGFKSTLAAGIGAEASMFMSSTVLKRILAAAGTEDAVRSPEMNWLDKGNSFTDINNWPGGLGRAILVSSTSTQCDFDQNESDLSVYTRYLVEGMKTGAADLDNDGVISVAELHKYASQKTQTVIPAIQPRIYSAADDNPIILAKAPVDDPKQRYRQEVERCANQGEISIVSRTILDVLRDTLGLPPEEAAAIEAGVIAPDLEYQKKLQRYAQEFVDAAHHELPIQDETRNRLRGFQQALGLTNADITPIEAQVARQIKTLQPVSDDVGELSEIQIAYREDLPRVKPLENAGAESEVKAPAPARTELPPVVLALQKRLNIGSLDGAHSYLALASKNPQLLVGLGIATVVLSLTGITAGIIYGLWQWQEWQDSQRLQTIRALTQERNYAECVTTAKTISQRSRHYTDAQALLEKCRTGAGWQNIQVQTLPGHSDTVWSLAISPDGQTLASGSGDKTIKLWDLQTGELTRTLSRGSDTVWSLAISPDGQTLASGNGDETIKLWNLQTGELIRTLSGHLDTVRTVTISPDGQTLASGSGDETIKLWNLQTGELIRTFFKDVGRVTAITISPDGQTLANGSTDNIVRLWNLQTGEQLRTLSGHSNYVNSVAISPDGQILASGSEDRTIKLWNLRTGELLRTLPGHPGNVDSVAISFDGRMLASGDKDGEIKIWRRYY